MEESCPDATLCIPPLKFSQTAVASSDFTLTHSKYEIEAKNLCYKIPRNHGPLWSRSTASKTGSDQYILENVSFVAKSGEILAIAGPSGAGKSTLLEVMAGRIRPSSPPQSILVNNKPMCVATFRCISGFIPQNDALFPLLTVKETLMFSASLRLPTSVCSQDKEEKVFALMEELRLSHVADTRVGNDDIRGLSGGERRRVSIGIDVIHEPCVLFLDEPTSGLDSAAALNVIEMLHAMAKTRMRTVILSIHQPGYKIIQQIKAFLILDNGHVVHHGSLGLLEYQLVAAGHKIPPQVNVLEYAMDALAAGDKIAVQMHVDTLNAATMSSLHLQALSHKYAQDVEKGEASEKQPNVYKHNMRGFIEAVHAELMQNEAARPTYANNSVHEVMVLAHRFAKNIFRTHELFTARTTQALVGGFALGTLYMNVGFTQSGIAKRLGFFAFTLTYLLTSTAEALPIFLQERHVLIPETSRGAYRVSSYLIGNLIVFLPFLLLVALLFSVPVYWLIGLSSAASAFLFFVLVVWLVLLMANSFVAFFSALVPDYIMGNGLISGCMGAFFLFSGYFISKQDMPSYWRFMHYISLFKYPLDALLINEYTHLESKCFSYYRPPTSPSPVCSLTTAQILEQLDLQQSSKWADVGIMLVFITVYRLLCYVILRFKVCRRKK